MKNPAGASNMVWGMYILIALNRIYRIQLAPYKISALPGWISIQTGTRLVIDALHKKFGALDYHDPRVQTVIQMAKSMELVKNPGSVRKNIFTFNNPPSGPADPAAVRELQLYIENDRDLYHQQFIPIVKNLMLKRRKGTYDREKAAKLFMYLMESGAKKYIKEFVQSSTPGSIAPKIDSQFNKNTRLEAARNFRDSFETEAEYGNYDRLIGPVSNPKKRSRKECWVCGQVRPLKYSHKYNEMVCQPCIDDGRGVRKNIFTFNNPRHSLNAMEQAAASVGLYVTTWAPGDGLTRYRFFLKPSSYDEGSGLYTAKGRGDAMAFIRAYGMGRGRKNPLTRSEAGYLLRHARSDVHEAGAARRYGLVGEQKYHTGRARGIGFAVQETGPKAARKAWVEMHTKLDRTLRNPVCSNPLIRGDKLPHDLKQQVLARFIYRWTSDNHRREEVWRGISGKPRIPLITDAQWLREHAFHVTKKGELDARHYHAEPGFMAKDNGVRPNPLLQTIGLAMNPPISAEWDRMSGQTRLHLLGFVGFPDAIAGQYARFPWVTLSQSAKRALERQWNDTGSGRRAGTTTRRRRLGVPVGANPLTRKESAKILRSGRRDIETGEVFRPGHTRSVMAGQALGKASVVSGFGPGRAMRAAGKVHDRASKLAATTHRSDVWRNPGLRLPKPGTRLTVTQALELAQRIGNRSLVKQCHAAMKLQRKSDRDTKCVVWKHLPIGSKNHLDGVVAMTHYGKSPEDMYRPPNGSKKGPHMYRHKWKRSVDVLASTSGKAIVKLMGPGQKVGDWMRG